MDRVIRGGLALSLVVALLAIPSVVAGEDNEPPLAEAGLDQQARAGETVRLDATGSRDTDGNVTGYDWSIETPSGGTITPDCGTCGTTSFSPGTPGRYNVTVTVTDDDGATKTDTLYVEVDPAPGPSVSLSGPADPTVEQSGTGGQPTGQATYVANFSRGGAPIDDVTWLVESEQTVQQSVNESSANSIKYVHSMESAANHTLTVRVVDTAGREATDSVSISPQVRNVGGGSDGGDDGYDGAMQVEWGDRTIIVQAPTMDASGDVVRQSNPTNRELTRAATADPGEEVETDFTDDGDGGRNENQDQVNEDPDEGYENGIINSAAGVSPGFGLVSGGSTSDDTGDSVTSTDLCLIC
ncbi:PKD domain-containing protein [Halorientalis pallida]|uniref:PKD/Chitinase domain-containing protein n=1 Tax=Halorientalis pallida TaxID=2479928 RepID=A0A498KSC7_9EURY|nr:PKD domain-containing protein [Halorientalis pallida]RXK47467.1 hypothetical protein EAF64_16985 [Halorientalis pallida]